MLNRLDRGLFGAIKAVYMMRKKIVWDYIFPGPNILLYYFIKPKDLPSL